MRLIYWCLHSFIHSVVKSVEIKARNPVFSVSTCLYADCTVLFLKMHPAKLFLSDDATLLDPAVCAVETQPSHSIPPFLISVHSTLSSSFLCLQCDTC